MKYTYHIWLFIVCIMCVLLSVSALAQSDAKNAVKPSDNIAMGQGNCPSERPVFDAEKCVECVMTLDCVGNRICDNNTCHCPGAQEFNPVTKDCACNSNKYPIGENTNPITCWCKDGFDLIKQEDGTFACVDPDTLADIDTSHLEIAPNEFVAESETIEDIISEELPVQGVE